MCVNGQISPVYRIFRFSDFVSSENGQVYFVNDVGFSAALEFDVLFFRPYGKWSESESHMRGYS